MSVVVPSLPRPHGSVTGEQRLNFHRVFHSHAKFDALIYQGGGGGGIRVTLLSVTHLHVLLQTVSNSFKPVFCSLLHTTLFGLKEVLVV